MHLRRFLAPLGALGLLGGLIFLSISPALAATPSSKPQVISDAALQALTATEGGAQVLPTTRTVAHWWGSTANPDDGITYGYNMVGADPNNCSGSACDVTVQADIVPVIVSPRSRSPRPAGWPTRPPPG